jgi:glycerophosphoryl diester phosphodiesterase
MKSLLLFILIFCLPLCGHTQERIRMNRDNTGLPVYNTLISTSMYWEPGIHAIKVDIHYNKDKKLVILTHSGKSCTAGGPAKSGKEQVQISNIDGLSYLNEVLKTVPMGKHLVVELNCKTECLVALETALAQIEKREQLMLVCYDWNTIVSIKNSFPNALCYWSPNTKINGQTLISVSRARLDGISISHAHINERLMKQAKMLNLEVHAHTVNDSAEAMRLFELGVDGIMTDCPELLVASFTK